MSHKRESRPVATRTAPHNTYTNDAKSTVLHKVFGHAPHEPLTAEDRRDLDVIVAAVERGFRISVQCRVCGHWLSHPHSVKAFMGPRCAAKVVGHG